MLMVVHVLLSLSSSSSGDLMGCIGWHICESVCQLQQGGLVRKQQDLKLQPWQCFALHLPEEQSCYVAVQHLHARCARLLLAESVLLVWHIVDSL